MKQVSQDCHRGITMAATIVQAFCALIPGSVLGEMFLALAPRNC
jgi:hypothetical protein